MLRSCYALLGTYIEQALTIIYSFLTFVQSYFFGRTRVRSLRAHNDDNYFEKNSNVTVVQVPGCVRVSHLALCAYKVSKLYSKRDVLSFSLCLTKDLLDYM